VVPTYDSAAALSRCLEGFSALNFDRDKFEVIISDDGSPESMEGVVAPFRDQLQITLITHPNTGPASARNRGAAQAKGTYLAFIDSDCIAAPDWLANLARRFAQGPDDLIGGGIINALPGNPYSAATQLIVTYVYLYQDQHNRGYRLFNSSNIAVPAEGFRKLGGFEESLRTGEDYDLCHRWQHAGLNATYAPEAFVYHSHLLTFPGFCRQHFGWGRGLLRYRMRIARRTGQPLQWQSTPFYLQLFRFPLTRGDGARGVLHALLVGVSQVVAAGGVLFEALVESWRAFRNARTPRY
jgi:glycosyltransferase involved in cell wall biosynthesis